MEARGQRSGSMTMKKNKIRDGSEAVTNVEDAIQLIGGFGRFQLLMAIITMGNYVRSALTYYPLPYLELKPVYMCTNSTDPFQEPFVCESDQFCKSNSEIKFDYIKYDDEPKSLHNWVEQLDMKCKSNSEIGLIGTMYFVGIIFSVLIVPRISDLYGRKWPIIVC